MTLYLEPHKLEAGDKLIGMIDLGHVTEVRYIDSGSDGTRYGDAVAQEFGAIYEITFDTGLHRTFRGKHKLPVIRGESQREWTKAELDAMAKRAREHGYFAGPGGYDLWVFCPLCRDRVEAKLPPRGKPWPALDEAVKMHVLGDHPYYREVAD